MAIKNRRPDLNGLLVIDKPLGWTSSHVCRHIRHLTQGAKVGHAGTLDPLATGVLVVCLGKATKLVDELMAHPKAYRAGLDLSRTSPTHDLEAPTVDVAVASPPSRDDIDRALQQFVGTIMQTPPAHSAVKVGGKRAYELARRGDLSCEPAPQPDPAAAPVDPDPDEEPRQVIEPRPVRIDGIDVISYNWPELTIEVRCGKGTYIRSLARDLGRALKTGGVLTSLVRTKSGPFGLAVARSPTALPAPLGPSDLLDYQPATAKA